jgi:hypothetical protein
MHGSAKRCAAAAVLDTFLGVYAAACVSATCAAGKAAD